MAGEMVTHFIQGVIDMVAQCIGNTYQLVGIIVAVSQIGSRVRNDPHRSRYSIYAVHLIGLTAFFQCLAPLHRSPRVPHGESPL